MSLPNLIEVQAADTVETAAAKITPPRNAVFLLLGSFDASIAPQVRSICARAIIPVGLMANALIVDNGAGDGLAAQMGAAVQEMDEAPPLVGILSPETATPDVNHPFLLKLPSEWSDPAKLSLQIVAELAKDGSTGEKPVIAILVGGTQADILTTLRCARRGWPILVVQGAGGLGDAILAAATPPADGSQAPEIADPDLCEIVDTAMLSALALNGHVDDLKRVLLGPIQLPGAILAEAWGRYNDLDRAAVDKQTRFRKIQLLILSMAVVAALLAVLSSSTAFPAPFLPWLHRFIPIPGWWVQKALHVLLVLAPITTAVLSGYNSRFREGNKWILLRAAAESIKREIFRYRTRSGAYSEAQCTLISSQSKLAANLKDITSNLVQSEVNKSNLPHRAMEGDFGMKFLRPEEYLIQRIEDQVNYFVSTTAKLYRRLKKLQLWIMLAGAAGTFVAAMGGDVWVAVTTAMATAFTAKLEIDQVENSIVQYNIALTNLRNIESWWKALSPWEKTRRRNIDLLVDQTETTLERETAGWIQQMQSELDKLTEKQASSDQQAQDDEKK